MANNFLRRIAFCKQLLGMELNPVMNNKVKDLISILKLYGNRESDPFIKFFFFFMCFDAWITAESGLDRDIDKIKWFLSNDNCLKNKWQEVQASRVKSLLNELQQYSPIYDMRPNHSNKKRELNDITNLDEIIWFIYQIRCNLFHGAKSPANTKDRGLVELSALILEKWIVWSVHMCLQDAI